MANDQTPAELMREQIADWERRLAEAQQVITAGEKALPGMRAALQAMGVAAQSHSAQEKERVNLESAASSNSSTVPSASNKLKRGDEIQGVILDALPKLPQTFEASNVEEALAAAGYEVNRSTLRQSLRMLAQLGRGLRVAREGAGRRAAIYEKL
jgi:hypothetical protein